MWRTHNGVGFTMDGESQRFWQTDPNGWCLSRLCPAMTSISQSESKSSDEVEFEDFLGLARSGYVPEPSSWSARLRPGQFVGTVPSGFDLGLRFCHGLERAAASDAAVLTIAACE